MRFVFNVIVTLSRHIYNNKYGHQSVGWLGEYANASFFVTKTLSPKEGQ